MLSVNKNVLSFEPIDKDPDIPPQLRVGDFDMDGYPDAVVTMTSLE
jgi:hypothetical protein